MAPMNDVLTRHKLDVDDYYRMAEAGIIGGRDRVELINGELIDMAPIGDEHVRIVNVMTEMLFGACFGRATVSVQNPVRLAYFDAPQPDLTLFRGRESLFRNSGPPRPQDIVLVVEVADSSLVYDSTVKSAVYAAAGIPEYWIADVPNRALIVHRQPHRDGYAEVTKLITGTRLPLAADASIVVDLAAVFD